MTPNSDNYIRIQRVRAFVEAYAEQQELDLTLAWRDIVTDLFHYGMQFSNGGPDDITVVVDGLLGVFEEECEEEHGNS